MSSPILGISELANRQANAEVRVNEAIRVLEAAASGRVIDRDLTAPPGSSNNGDLYIVATSATGDWAGQDGNFALWSSGWIFYTPVAGMTIYVVDETKGFMYDGSAWQEITFV